MNTPRVLLVLTLLASSCGWSVPTAPGRTGGRADPSPQPLPPAPKPAPSSAVPDLHRLPIWGVDVSHYQGTINWRKVARSSFLKFAYIKATEGAGFVDNRFRQNWERAHAAGLKVGAYHYFSFCHNGESQARNFLARVPAAKDALPPAVDVEFPGNCTTYGSVEKVRLELSTFLTRLREKLHRDPVIYAGGAEYQLFVAGLEGQSQLWVRSIGGEPGGIPWSLWQFSATARIPGIATDVDLNALGGIPTTLELGALGGALAEATPWRP